MATTWRILRNALERQSLPPDPAARIFEGFSDGSPGTDAGPNRTKEATGAGSEHLVERFCQQAALAPSVGKLGFGDPGRDQRGDAKRTRLNKMGRQSLPPDPAGRIFEGFSEGSPGTDAGPNRTKEATGAGSEHLVERFS